jgi:chromosome segregation ATPase
MQIRYKIFILLFSVTLGLGTFILLQPSEDNDDAVRRFRSLFSNRPAYSVRDLSNSLTALGDETSLWYGGIAFFALIMMGLTLKMARRGPRALNARPEKLEVAKAEPPRAESSPRVEARQERRSRQTNKDLEASIRRVDALETALSEKEQLLKSRDGELETLQTRVSALTERSGEMPAAKALEEGMLREELRRKTELLQQKESAVGELEKSLSGKVGSLESQLKEKEKLLESRSKEAERLRSELNSATGRLTGLESASEQAGVLLQEELQKKAQVLKAKGSLVRELQESTGKTVDVLKSQLAARETLLKNRDAELDTLRSEITALSARLRESGVAKEQAESLLRAELSKANRAPRANHSVVTEPQESLMSVQDLKSRLSDGEHFLSTPEGKIQKLEADLKEKRTQLARYEIQIRQSMERRDIWKRRLAKFGITLKD